MWGRSVTIGAAVVAFAVSARADDEPRPTRFGSRGQLVLGSAASAAISSRRYDTSDAHHFAYGVSPWIEWFVVKDFSLGLSGDAVSSLDHSYDFSGALRETKRTFFSAALRLGVNLPMGRWVSFYPRLLVGIESIHEEQSNIGLSSYPVATFGNPNLTQVRPWAQLLAPLVVHARTHFFLGGGPTLTHELAGDDVVNRARTTLGTTAFVGGTWGGEAHHEDADDPDEPRVTFGQRKQVVFTGDVGVRSAWENISGLSVHAFSVDVTPGFDYFVADHVSVGFEGNLHYGSTIDPAFAGDTFGLAAAGTVGVAATLSDWASWWVRGALGVGWTSVQPTGGSSYKVTTLFASVFAPLIFTIREHFFFGLGPRFSTDLLGLVSESPVQLRGTTIGASTVVGGWL